MHGFVLTISRLFNVVLNVSHAHRFCLKAAFSVVNKGMWILRRANFFCFHLLRWCAVLVAMSKGIPWHHWRQGVSGFIFNVSLFIISMPALCCKQHNGTETSVSAGLVLRVLYCCHSRLHTPVYVTKTGKKNTCSRLVSPWISVSHQPHRVTSGWTTFNIILHHLETLVTQPRDCYNVTVHPSTHL